MNKKMVAQLEELTDISPLMNILKGK